MSNDALRDALEDLSHHYMEQSDSEFQGNGESERFWFLRDRMIILDEAINIIN